MDTHDTSLKRSIGSKRHAIGTRNDRARIALKLIRSRPLIDSNLIITQIENELERTTGENRLFQTWRIESAIQPQILYELGERGERPVRTKQHPRVRCEKQLSGVD